jgi:dienelactone hydrolase
MKKYHLFVFSVLFGLQLPAQDILQTPLVLQTPAMAQVRVESRVAYKTVGDTTLFCNLYFPPDPAGGPRPAVVFVNGVGLMDLPDWRIYRDWSRLVATEGLIGVTFQSRGWASAADGADLLRFLEKNAAKYGLDASRIALWASSANTTAGMRLALPAENRQVRALVIYYGMTNYPADLRPTRQDLPILMVRAGLDRSGLNSGMELFLKNALEADVPIEFINYLRGRHGFDGFDDNDDSRRIIRRTVDFLRAELTRQPPLDPAFVPTPRNLYFHLLAEGRTAEYIALARQAAQRQRAETSPLRPVWVEDNTLTNAGYELLKRQRPADARLAFEAAVELFPESANAYDSLGDYFEASGDPEKAVENARKALEALDKSRLFPAQAQAIRESAEGKIRRLKKG